MKNELKIYINYAQVKVQEEMQHPKAMYFINENPQ